MEVGDQNKNAQTVNIAFSIKMEMCVYWPLSQPHPLHPPSQELLYSFQYETVTEVQYGFIHPNHTPKPGIIFLFGFLEGRMSFLFSTLEAIWVEN